MEAKELRLGNLCKEITHSSNGVVKVAVRHFEDIDKGEIDLFPVVLTEVWLLKFGFEEGEDYLDELVYEYHTPEYTFQLTNNCGSEWYCGNEETYLEIKYVHQLQNLYFALTGKELTIK